MLVVVSMKCAVCDELAIQFLLAEDQAADATRQVRHAVTPTQEAIAQTFLRRALEHESYAADELINHRCRCLCIEPEVEALAGRITRLHRLRKAS